MPLVVHIRVKVAVCTLWSISGLRRLCAPLVVHIRVKVAVCLLWFISGLRWLCASCGSYQG